MAGISQHRSNSELEPERRGDESPPVRMLKNKLNTAQLTTVNSLERFGWYLKFVRHQPPSQPVAVLCDPDTRKFAILDPEGDLDENPVFEKFRQSSAG